jgi:hypothetical protein
MSYKIEVSHRVDTKDGEITRNDIVLSKTTTIKSGTGGFDHVIQGGYISFPYEDLQILIDDLTAKLNKS